MTSLMNNLKDEIVNEFLDNVCLSGYEIRGIARLLLSSFIIEFFLLSTYWFYSKSILLILSIIVPFVAIIWIIIKLFKISNLLSLDYNFAPKPTIIKRLVKFNKNNQ
jgi:hypothetical protein